MEKFFVKTIAQSTIKRFVLARATKNILRKISISGQKFRFAHDQGQSSYTCHFLLSWNLFFHCRYNFDLYYKYFLPSETSSSVQKFLNKKIGFFVLFEGLYLMNVQNLSDFDRWVDWSMVKKLLQSNFHNWRVEGKSWSKKWSIRDNFLT